MGNNDNSGLIWGIIIGAIIAFALLSRNNQQILSQQSSQQSQQSQQQTPVWKPMDIPRVDDIKPQTISQPIIQVQQDPQLIKALTELQKTNSQLEQTTSKLMELQDAVSKLRDNQPQQIIIQQPAIQQPIYQPPQITVQQQPEIVQQPIQPPQTAQPMQEQQIYKNSEKWQIIRGKDGRIKSLEIARDVKKTS